MAWWDIRYVTVSSCCRGNVSSGKSNCGKQEESRCEERAND